MLAIAAPRSRRREIAVSGDCRLVLARASRASSRASSTHGTIVDPAKSTEEDPTEPITFTLSNCSSVVFRSEAPIPPRGAPPRLALVNPHRRIRCWSARNFSSSAIKGALSRNEGPRLRASSFAIRLNHVPIEPNWAELRLDETSVRSLVPGSINRLWTIHEVGMRLQLTTGSRDRALIVIYK